MPFDDTSKRERQEPPLPWFFSDTVFLCAWLVAWCLGALLELFIKEHLGPGWRGFGLFGPPAIMISVYFFLACLDIHRTCRT